MSFCEENKRTSLVITLCSNSGHLISRLNSPELPQILNNYSVVVLYLFPTQSFIGGGGGGGRGGGKGGRDSQDF